MKTELKQITRILLSLLFIGNIIFTAYANDQWKTTSIYTVSKNDKNNWNKNKIKYKSLKKSDEDKINNIVDNFDLHKQRDYLQKILNRISTLRHNISWSNMIQVRKDRFLELLEDMRLLIQTKLDELPVEKDTTPPIISSLTLSWTFSSWTTLSFVSNESGRGYYVVIPSWILSPSVAQVKDWKDGNWIIAEIKWSMGISNWINYKTITWLTPNTSYSVYLVLEDKSKNLQTTVANISFFTPSLNIISPVISTYSISWITYTWASLSINANMSWKVYYVILPSWNTIPNTQQIKDWKDASWSLVNLRWDSNTLTWANIVTFAWLSPWILYTIHFIYEDILGNLQSPVYSISFSSLAWDIVPPMLYSYYISWITSTWVSLSVGTSEPWKLYAVVIPSFNTAPNAQQIKEWKDSAWNIINLKSSTDVTSWTNVLTMSWLAVNNVYTIYFTQEDTSWNLLLDVKNITFVTSSK